MPNNYVLLERTELNASAASVTFANIPQTGYTDLKVVASARSTKSGAGSDWIKIAFNGSSANQTARVLYGEASTASSYTDTSIYSAMDSNSLTANTFGNTEFYIPNYAGSTNKSVSSDGVSENNATTGNYLNFVAGLWSSTAAITSITLTPYTGPNFVANSTFSLYGLAALGTTPARAPKASGGNRIDYDGTYWIHTFNTSGTFTPQIGLTCDYLVVAGGGGGAQTYGGGGAGGLRSTVTATGGGGSLESALTLALSTNYTVTIGAGGAGGIGISTTQPTAGSNSVFSTITSTGGGLGVSNSGTNTASSGGSGGGGKANSTGSGLDGGTGTANQGRNGGAGVNNGTVFLGGGGGGALNAGSGGGAGSGGAGGAGVAVSITGSSVTYAGGGGGGTAFASGSKQTPGAGGAGGGGSSSDTTGSAGTVNSGGGGGAANSTLANAGDLNSLVGGAGGSGIVIIRYLA